MLNTEQDDLENLLVLLPVMWCSSLSVLAIVCLCMFRHEIRHSRTAIYGYANNYLKEMSARRQPRATDSNEPGTSLASVRSDAPSRAVSVSQVEMVHTSHNNHTSKQLIGYSNNWAVIRSLQRRMRAERRRFGPSHTGRRKKSPVGRVDVAFGPNALCMLKQRLRSSVRHIGQTLMGLACPSYKQPHHSVRSMLTELYKIPMYAGLYGSISVLQKVVEMVGVGQAQRDDHRETSPSSVTD